MKTRNFFFQSFCGLRIMHFVRTQNFHKSHTSYHPLPIQQFFENFAYVRNEMNNPAVEILTNDNHSFLLTFLIVCETEFECLLFFKRFLLQTLSLRKAKILKVFFGNCTNQSFLPVAENCFQCLLLETCRIRTRIVLGSL